MREIFSKNNSKIFVVIASIITISLLFLYTRKATSFFDHGVYSFNDVTYLNDVVSNTIYLKKPFFVSQLNSQWLSKPVSVSHILLVPLYLLTDSQFIIVFLPILSLILSLVIFGILVYQTLRKNNISELTSRLISIILPLSLLSNSYFESVIFSAHPEVYITLSITLLCFLILNGISKKVVIPILLITLGLRIDVAVYTIICLFMLLLIKPLVTQENRLYKQNIYKYLFICLFYFIIAYSFLFDSENLTNELGQYGKGPLSIIYGVLTSPGLVIEKIKTSAFWEFNQSFFFFHLIFSPLLWLLKSISGMVLFLSNDLGKTLLWDYQSSFLTPGLYLCFISGINNLCKLKSKIENFVPIDYFLPIIYLTFSLTLIFFAGERNLDLIFKNFDFHKENINVTIAKNAIKLFESKCPNEKKFATDPQISPFLRLSYEKVLINNFERANIAISFGDINPRQGNSLKAPNSMWETKEYDLDKDRLKDSPLFEKVFVSDKLNTYVRKGTGCLKNFK
ncbi:MAG: hypothetical protein CME70_09545 [Halobacteriovorax sp.]|nr:hypothetical protein [Halobacteriovorax sp.]|tara:strand:+ start:157625 stop:159151 length:1527 start_codon:yes stop_codon:yes gene_type:complete